MNAPRSHMRHVLTVNASATSSYSTYRLNGCRGEDGYDKADTKNQHTETAECDSRRLNTAKLLQVHLQSPAQHHGKNGAVEDGITDI